MAKSSQAKRQNRLIGLVAVLLLVVAGLSAVRETSSGSSPSNTSTPSGTDHSGHSGSLTRPADTSLSWFNHSLSVEQFDYNMSSLSCTAMAKYITVDLCAVVKSELGDFMVVGTEGYWDPQETNSAGIVKVPLDLTVYVLTSENGQKRAMSVMDGTVSVDYDGDATVMSAYVVNTEQGEVLALHKHPQAQASGSYDFWDELQVVATSPTGAPTLVAAYEGSNIHLVGDGTGIVFSSDRYASPTGSSTEPKWSTLTSLFPAGGEPYSWNESMRSGPRLSVRSSVKPVVLADSYDFPNSASAKADA
ncbi:MAG: hypothetical protein RL430_2016 [Actinomycetota bacterium]|jgi:hypothetical protein